MDFSKNHLTSTKDRHPTNEILQQVFEILQQQVFTLVTALFSTNKFFSAAVYWHLSTPTDIVRQNIVNSYDKI